MSSNNDPRTRMRRTPRLTMRPRGTAGLYVGAGVVGATVGLIAGHLVSYLVGFVPQADPISKSFRSVLLYGLQLGVFASCLALALIYATQYRQQRALAVYTAVRTAAYGFFAGAISGALLQTLYNGWSDSRESPSWIIDFVAWILLGALLGEILALLGQRTAPKRAISVGLLAGLLAGLVRWAGSSVGLSAPASSRLGLLLFGATLGLLMFMIRGRDEEPTLEVHWTPQKVTTLGLGGRPVTVGGGADDIVLRGAPPKVSTILMENGVIEHIETSTGKRTPLKDGSRLRIGGLVMVVHAPE